MDIIEFAFRSNKEILREVFTKTWKIETTKERLETSKLSRIEIVKIHLDVGCKDLLIHGRGKNKNLIISTSVNYAKTVILRTLKLIFSNSIIENPAND